MPPFALGSVPDPKLGKQHKGSPEQSERGTGAEGRWADSIGEADPPTFSSAQQMKMCPDKARGFGGAIPDEIACAHLDSNQGPPTYQAGALTN